MANIKCVAADPKAKECLVGLDNGNLHLGTWSGEVIQWDVLYSGGSEITAVEVDFLRNHKDYPDIAVGYFGSNGKLYRSVDSYNSWSELVNFFTEIVDIGVCEVNNNRIVVGLTDSIYYSSDFGNTWTQGYYGFGDKLKNIFVREFEIQAVFEGGNAQRSYDFGVSWFPLNDAPTAEAVGFDVDNPQNSVIGGNEILYVFSGASGEIFYYQEGATVDGRVTDIDVDRGSNTTLVATDQKVYKTVDWGNNVRLFKDVAADIVEIGGSYVVHPRYYFNAQARNSAGESDWGEERSFELLNQ